MTDMRTHSSLSSTATNSVSSDLNNISDLTAYVSFDRMIVLFVIYLIIR